MNAVAQDIIAGLRGDGYAVARGALPEADKLLNEVQEIHRSYDYAAIRDIPNQDRGQQTIYNLQNKSLLLVKALLGNELIEAVLVDTLNDTWHKAIPADRPNYILRSYLARNNQAATPMHIDSLIPFQGEYPLSVQLSLVLEPQDEVNGCTVLVPGSHQSGEYTEQSARDKAIPIETEAGDIVFWDARIWHGTGENQSGNSRWALIGTFVRWWVKQGYRITDALPDSIYSELTDSQKAVMGYCALPFLDETEGIDFKTGYENLE